MACLFDDILRCHGVCVWCRYSEESLCVITQESMTIREIGEILCPVKCVVTSLPLCFVRFVVGKFVKTTSGLEIDGIKMCPRYIHWHTTLFCIVCWLFFCTEHILRNTHYRGFPVVESQESRFLIGYVSRRDLTISICKTPSVCLSVCLSLSADVVTHIHSCNADSLSDVFWNQDVFIIFTFWIHLSCVRINRSNVLWC